MTEIPEKPKAKRHVERLYSDLSVELKKEVDRFEEALKRVKELVEKLDQEGFISQKYKNNSLDRVRQLIQKVEKSRKTEQNKTIRYVENKISSAADLWGGQAEKLSKLSELVMGYDDLVTECKKLAMELPKSHKPLKDSINRSAEIGVKRLENDILINLDQNNADDTIAALERGISFWEGKKTRLHHLIENEEVVLPKEGETRDIKSRTIDAENTSVEEIVTDDIWGTEDKRTTEKNEQEIKKDYLREKENLISEQLQRYDWESKPSVSAIERDGRDYVTIECNGDKLEFVGKEFGEYHGIRRKTGQKERMYRMYCSSRFETVRLNNVPIEAGLPVHTLFPDDFARIASTALIEHRLIGKRIKEWSRKMKELNSEMKNVIINEIQKQGWRTPVNVAVETLNFRTVVTIKCSDNTVLFVGNKFREVTDDAEHCSDDYFNSMYWPQSSLIHTIAYNGNQFDDSSFYGCDINENYNGYFHSDNIGKLTRKLLQVIQNTEITTSSKTQEQSAEKSIREREILRFSKNLGLTTEETERRLNEDFNGLIEELLIKSYPSGVDVEHTETNVVLNFDPEYYNTSIPDGRFELPPGTYVEKVVTKELDDIYTHPYYRKYKVYTLRDPAGRTASMYVYRGNCIILRPSDQNSLFRYRTKISQVMYKTKEDLSGLSVSERNVDQISKSIMQEDRGIALEILKRRGKYLKHMPKLQDDDEAVMIAVRETGDAIEYASRRLQQRKDIQRAALGVGRIYDNTVRSFVDRGILSLQNLQDPVFMLEVVRLSGSLYSISEAIGNEALLENEEFALNAIKFHGITLRDFPKFIQDKLFVIEAVKASPDEIRYVPFEMLDQDLIRASDYSIEKLRSRFIPKKLLVEIFTPAFIEEYVQKKPDWSIVRIYMLFEAINSEEEFSACVEKMDRSVILNDIIKSPGRIVFYPHLKKNPKFIEEAIKINPDIKKYLQD